MGTLSYSVGRYAPSRGQSPALLSSYVVASGTHGTSVTASDISSLAVTRGDVLQVFASEAMRLAVGGTASATNGHYVPAETLVEYEAHDTGAVSVVDVA